MAYPYTLINNILYKIGVDNVLWIHLAQLHNHLSRRPLDIESIITKKTPSLDTTSACYTRTYICNVVHIMTVKYTHCSYNAKKTHSN